MSRKTKLPKGKILTGGRLNFISNLKDSMYAEVISLRGIIESYEVFESTNDVNPVSYLASINRESKERLERILINFTDEELAMYKLRHGS